MKTKLLGIALFVLTLAAVVYYPQLIAKNIAVNPPVNHHITNNHPKIDVVFVLDTTGSMGGLIQTAKEKIWSIATTMASAQPAPEIRIGLVAYRDRGFRCGLCSNELPRLVSHLVARLKSVRSLDGG